MSRVTLDDFGDILSPAEVRAVLGIGQNKIYELLVSGAIKSFRIGRDRKIPKECVREYIHSRLVDGTASHT